MNKKSRIFYAKVLLFGEYSILFDSMGLSIPYTHFSGELSFINDDNYTDYNFAVSSNRMLAIYVEWLRQLEARNELPCKINLIAFERDISRTLYFESTIPQGYGIGSSGALVAAVYDKYAEDKIQAGRGLTTDEINKLKSIFSVLESYFHGTSSGIDPLNCYIKHPLLIHNRKNISITGIPRNKSNRNSAIFLIDTGVQGKTGPLVQQFIEKSKDNDFLKLIFEELIPFNNHCISDLISGNTTGFMQSLKKLSYFLLKHLTPMIPAPFMPIWKEGLETGYYFLKLCGSGGGGFLLGFTSDFDQASISLAKHGIEPVTIYRAS
jgi:mevalonate kinase